MAEWVESLRCFSFIQTPFGEKKEILNKSSRTSQTYTACTEINNSSRVHLQEVELIVTAGLRWWRQDQRRVGPKTTPTRDRPKTGNTKEPQEKRNKLHSCVDCKVNVW